VKSIQGTVVPIKRDDIDTDVIIPASFLTTTTKMGLGEHVFSEVRQMEADFPFNQEKYDNAKILVTGKNFGCGSSREHAPWALADWGIQAVIASSFADIFYNNALKNKIVPVILPDKIIEKIVSNEGGSGDYTLTVDIESLLVTLPCGTHQEFELEPFRRECLMDEMDELDYLLSRLKLIKSFKKRKKVFFYSSKVETLEEAE
jgi:3-isopropylmalate/(R)-2-methylmalate dehydratase small subunit